MRLALPDESAEYAREVGLGLEPDRKRHVDNRHAGFDKQLLGALDPAAEQVLVRAKTRRSSKLRREMHASKTGRSSNISQTDGISEVRLYIFGRPLQPPSHQLICVPPLRLDGWGRFGEKPCDDGGADTVHIELIEGIAEILGA